MTDMPLGDSSPISLAFLVFNFLFWLWVTIKVGLHEIHGKGSSELRKSPETPTTPKSADTQP